MKKISSIWVIGSLVSSQIMTSQTLAFDALNANSGIGKTITWLSSTYGNGYGHKIYNDDNSGRTYLKFAGRDNSSTWVDMMTITSTKKVGIGTTFPLTGLSLEFNENQTALGQNSFAAVRINNSYSASFGRRSELQFGLDQNSNNTLAVIAAEYSDYNSDVAGDLVFGTNPVQSNSVVERMRITGKGNVIINGQTRIGIKSSSAHTDAKLMVDGKIVCKDLYVTATSDWPDFVFEANYKLENLYEIQNYFQVNKHLPNVPTACEIEEKGINIAEMSNIQMQKIEELTLYVIELKTELDALKKQVSEKK